MESIHAVESLQNEMETCFKRINTKLNLLRLTLPEAPPVQLEVLEETKAKVPMNAADGLQEEPAALHVHNMQSDGTPKFKSYASFRIMNSSGEDPTVLRLHGRWMQLSTQCSFYTASMGELNRKTNHLPPSMSLTFSERGFSGLLEASAKRPLHPEGYFRICWDLCSLVLLLIDAIFLPLSIAWDWSWGFGSVSGAILSGSIYVGLVFWTLDIVLNFNTAVYIQGQLVTKRRRIMRRYLSTWFALDISIVILDYLNLAQDYESNLSFLRFGRIVRAFRMLRLLKMSKLDAIIQELAASTGRQWIMLVISIFNAAVAAICVAHIITCLWFWIGSTVQAEGRESWIDIALAHDLDGATQYITSLRYVMNAPAPPLIAPDSVRERLVDIMNNVFTLVVIGSAVSKISGTLVELRAMNESRSRQRREIRVYLSNQDASFELVSRIMKFVEYKLDKISPVTFDSSLISMTLQTELYVSQRGQYMELLPICNLTKVLYPETFAYICAKLQKQVFETKEKIFVTGAVATSLYITVTGKFIHVEAEDPKTERLVTGNEWFGELALYGEGVIQHATLSARTFSEVLSLEQQDLIETLRSYPECASMFCDYAKAFIDNMRKPSAKSRHKQELDEAEHCCRQTKQYQELYPDPKTRLKNIRLFPTDLEELDEAFELMPLDAGAESGTLPRRPVNGGLLEYIKALSGPDLQMESLQQDLRTHLPEIHIQHGSYTIFEQAGERDRAESSCISLLSMIYDRYDLLVHPQVNEDTRLRRDQWGQLQDLISWAKPSHQQIHAALVLLAIRGLGKSTTVQSQIQSCEGRPEQAVLYLVENARNVVPSVAALSPEALHYVRSVLQVHETFNFAQMLQGENVPASVAQLQEKIRQHGIEVFHCYVMFLLGFMAGLGGGRGSKFLGARNGEVLIASMQVFSNLLSLTPRSVYWGYLRARANSFKASFITGEDLAIVRLACLSRVHDQREFVALRHAWSSLDRKERGTLVEHLLADGIQQRAVIFTFLPDCIQHSMLNASVGLTRLLQVLVDLLKHLKMALGNTVVHQMVFIDLSDFSENTFIFQTCISRCKLDVPEAGQRPHATLEMTSNNWGRISEADTDLMSVDHRVREVRETAQGLRSCALSCRIHFKVKVTVNLDELGGLVDVVVDVVLSSIHATSFGREY
eukprot:s20_g9.t2